MQMPFLIPRVTSIRPQHQQQCVRVPAAVMPPGDAAALMIIRAIDHLAAAQLSSSYRYVHRQSLT
jgi:hypothetical protein